MTVAYSDFVKAFPALKDQEKFPQDLVEYWMSQAPLQVNARRMGKLMPLATMLFAAHNVVLEAQNVQASSSPDGIPGTPTGPIQSQTVGQVSVSYDTKETAIEGAGAWNATMYGQRLYTLMKATNLGPVYRRPPIRRAPF